MGHADLPEEGAVSTPVGATKLSPARSFLVGGVSPQRRYGAGRLLAFMLGTLLTACASHAVPHGVGRGAAVTKRAQMEGAVQQFMASTRAPGVAMALVENGRVSFTASFGYSDLENPARVNEHTLFRLGSLSKLFTAAAAMRLSEQEQLDLDAPVQRYCPAFPDKVWSVTTRQVLAHAGGIRHYKSESPDDPEISNTKHCQDPIQSGLEFFADDPLVAPPGTQFHYSTQGYTLIGCVLEGAAGAKYVELVKRNVLVPSAMSETRPDDRLALIARRTRFYRKSESGDLVLNADPLDSCYKLPGGGWLSTATDMGRFAAALLNDQILQRATRDAMWHPVRPIDGTNTAYTLGWVAGGEDGLATLGHTGGQQGTSTVLLIAPGPRTAVVVLANMEKVPVLKLARELLKIAL